MFLPLLTDPAGLFATLTGLRLPHGSYVICGSAALYVRGLRDHMGDLDVLAIGPAWNIATTLGAPRPAPSGHGQVIRHPHADIEVFDRWTPGWSSDRLIATADTIDGLPFMRLSCLLAWKQAALRPKDLPDIAAVSALCRMWTGHRDITRPVSEVHR